MESRQVKINIYFEQKIIIVVHLPAWTSMARRVATHTIHWLLVAMSVVIKCFLDFVIVYETKSTWLLHTLEAPPSTTWTYDKQLFPDRARRVFLFGLKCPLRGCGLSKAINCFITVICRSGSLQYCCIISCHAYTITNNELKTSKIQRGFLQSVNNNSHTFSAKNSMNFLLHHES